MNAVHPKGMKSMEAFIPIYNEIRAGRSLRCRVDRRLEPAPRATDPARKTEATTLMVFDGQNR